MICKICVLICSEFLCDNSKDSFRKKVRSPKMPVSLLTAQAASAEDFRSNLARKLHQNYIQCVTHLLKPLLHSHMITTAFSTKKKNP